MTGERRQAVVDAIQRYYQSKQGTAEDEPKRYRRHGRPRRVNEVLPETFGGLLADVEKAIDEGSND
jgi:hypothetical protein